MSYSLDDFCNDVRTTLRTEDSPATRESVRRALEKLLADKSFCDAYVGAGNDSGMVQIFEDEETHFCVLAYNMPVARTSPPHDHGSSWAVYGQASGYTDMTIWESATPDARIQPVRAFRLEPGEAGLFDVREIHSIAYPAGARFVRVTGVDMSKEARRVYDPETGEAREISHVGTGKA